MRVMKSWCWAVLLCALAGVATAGLREGELTPGMTNPGSVEFPAWFKNTFLDLGEDVSEAGREGKRVMLFFYQDGCPYCKKLVEYNFTQHDVVDKARASVDVIAINMWGDREVTWVDGETMSEKDFARKMRVMFTPTILFLDRRQAGPGLWGRRDFVRPLGPRNPILPPGC